MIPVNGPSFGRRRRLALRRYPGGTENDSILRTVLRSSTKHPRGLAGAHPLDMTRPPNPCVQLHPIHPPRLPVRATLTEGYTRSHFGPPQPDQPAASVGDYCAAVLSAAEVIIVRRSLLFAMGRADA